MAQRQEHLARIRPFAAVLAAATLVLAACGGAAVPSPTPTAAVAKASLPPATAAPATAAPATQDPATAAPTPAAVVNIEAGENEVGFYMKADRLTVAAGTVTINFANKGRLTHELMVYPLQDVTQLVAFSRLGKHGHADEVIKGLAAEAEDVEPGKSATLTATLEPGFYEIACHLSGKDPNGSSFSHYDYGQLLTLAVVGTGGPPATVGTPGSTLAVEMNGDEKASWLFSPDRLVVPAGDVTFKVTNSMKAEHDFVVHPLGDTTKVVNMALMPGMGHIEDWSVIKGTELFEDLEPGKTGTKTLKLTPGLYMAACYMVSKVADGTSFIHRDRGQRIVFEVR